MHTFVDGELLTATQLNTNFNEIKNTTDNRHKATDNRLKALETRSGWTGFPANGIWTANSALSYFREGRTVHIQGKLAVDGTIGIRDYLRAFYLPAEVRPLRDVFHPVALRFQGATPNYKAQAVLRLGTDGQCHLYTEVAGADAAFIGGISWLI